MSYSSYDFCEIQVYHVWQAALREVHATLNSGARVSNRADASANLPREDGTTLHIRLDIGRAHSQEDYRWRPTVLDSFPWYFFQAAKARPGTLGTHMFRIGLPFGPKGRNMWYKDIIPCTYPRNHAIS